MEQHPQQIGIPAPPDSGFNIWQGQQGAADLLYRNGGQAVPFQNPIEGHIAEPGQNDAVHFVQGIGGQRKITPPLQVIEQCSHRPKAPRFLLPL